MNLNAWFPTFMRVVWFFRAWRHIPEPGESPGDWVPTRRPRLWWALPSAWGWNYVYCLRPSAFHLEGMQEWFVNLLIELDSDAQWDIAEWDDMTRILVFTNVTDANMMVRLRDQEDWYKILVEWEDAVR